MYRKSIYDYIYKSKTQAITDKMFQDMMRKSIMDDIKHDKQEDKEYRIKEKLNIWFSMYNYFTNSKTNENMVNKTQELFEKLKTIAGSENNAEFIKNDDEFAFAAGQLIRTILNKSESGERSHALLEPFLQKTECGKLKLAIARAFDTYKHAFKFYKGDANRYEFDKIMSNVMGYETKTNMKDLLPMILAGYFSETIFKKEKEKELEQSL
jgi:CRISPR-associated protein Csh1